MYRNSKHTVIFPLLLAAGVVLGLLLGQFMGRNSAESQLRGILTRLTQPDNKLNYTLSLIENRYVDSVSMDSLVEHVIPLVTRELDPHSVYIPASEMQALNEPLEGEFDGIGVVFNMATDTVIVLNVIPSGPSDKAGVRAGDRIIEIDDSLVAGRKLPQNDVVRMLRGPRGTKVKLSLGRQGISGLVDAEVVRDAIPIKSIESAFVIVDGIGYVKLSQFARTSHAELLLALARLRSEGAERLIFDLRGNSGGYLDQAISIANEFLHEGQLIVYTEDRAHRQERQYADGRGSAQEIEVAVLIDEGSASSSEILAGALQDNDRGTIIGRRSFGKGLVQQQIPYSDGSALRLTTARYFTPTGRSIQKPYTIGDDEAYEEDIWNRYRNNEFFSADSIRFADSLKRVTPGGKVVYGGGGIMPDIFVPNDTSGITSYYINVANAGLLQKFAFDYVDANRDKFEGVQTVGELETLLPADDTLLRQFVNFASRNGVSARWYYINISHDLIVNQLKGLIARDVLGYTAYFSIVNRMDATVSKAVEELLGGGASFPITVAGNGGTPADSIAAETPKTVK